MKVGGAGRARGGNRGGCGGGYEATDPDYAAKRLRKLREEYLAMDPRWRETFLEGLSKYEQDVARGKVKVYL